MKLSWGKRVDANFREAIFMICSNFQWPTSYASWLMACIAFESAETFSSSIRNAAGSGAIGLIQFMPSTARSLGTTTDELTKMTPIQQLEYVEKYFSPYASKIKSLPSMYMAILMPKYVTAADDAILFSGGVAYRQNSGLDINQDGLITKAEAASRVQAKYVKGMRAENAL